MEIVVIFYIFGAYIRNNLVHVCKCEQLKTFYTLLWLFGSLETIYGIKLATEMASGLVNNTKPCSTRVRFGVSNGPCITRWFVEDFRPLLLELHFGVWKAYPKGFQCYANHIV